MKIASGKAAFQPLTLTLQTPADLAALVGALGAYGKGKTKCKKTLREAGLVEHYNGNVRKWARETVVALAEAGGFSVPDFSGLKVDTEAIEEALELEAEDVAVTAARPVTSNSNGCGSY